MKLLKTALLICVFAAGLKFSYAQVPGKLPSTTLWKISGNGLSNDSYIYLTTALCDTKTALSENAEKALRQVKVIAVESNLNSKENAPKLPNLITVTNDSQRIKNILPLSAYNQLLSTAKEKYGMNELILNQFKPFYINAFLLRNANPCESANNERVEDVLNDFAKKNNIKYKEIFTPEEIVTEYDAGSPQYWQQNIMYLYNNSDQVKLDLQNKNNLYASQNSEGLKSLFSSNNYYKIKYNSPVIKEHVQAALSKIENIIKTQPAFITVDAGYFLTNGGSMAELLQRDGYTVKPVETATHNTLSKN